MSDYTDPRRSVALLQQLRACGWSDTEFARLHHFGPDSREAIQSHIDDCSNTRQIRPDSNNAILQAKPELEVLRLRAD